MSSKDIDPNDLRALRGDERETPGASFEDRKRLERNARMRADGRRGRPVEAVLHLNVALPPDLKARLVRTCKARDIKIVDFVRDWLERGLDTLEKE